MTAPGGEIGLLLFCLLAAFFLGSIPTGFLLVKSYEGVDIRTLGSGNIGSTNVRRVAGTRIAVTTQILDILKGLAPVAAGVLLARRLPLPMDHELFLPALALAAIIGHDFTPFLGFRGGKGVNTTVGAFLLLTPLPVLLSVAFYFGLRFVTRIVSIRSLALSVSLAVATALTARSRPLIYAAVSAAFLIVACHHGNLGRLVRGKEPGEGDAAHAGLPTI
jgi:glycerol-3-phosphate acyltransferase PlsY